MSPIWLIIKKLTFSIYFGSTPVRVSCHLFLGANKKKGKEATKREQTQQKEQKEEEEKKRKEERTRVRRCGQRQW